MRIPLVLAASCAAILPAQNGPFAAEPRWPDRWEPPPRCDTCGFGSGSSFVHTLAAESLRAGHFGGGLRFDWQEFDAFSDAQLLQFSAQGIGAHSIDRSLVLRAGAAYGVADDCTVGLDLPFVNHRDLREAALGGTPDFEANGDQSGLGDLSLFVQWCGVKDPAAERYLSLYAGARLPTGDTRLQASDGTRLEADHQPGSGSVDPFVGVAVAQSFGATTLAASAAFTLAGDGAQGSNLGDVLRVSCGVGWMPEQAADATASWRFMLELTSEWRRPMHLDGAVDPNTGGVQVFLAPGVRVSWKSGLSWFASVGLPVLQNLDGEQAETRFRVAAGVSLSF